MTAACSISPRNTTPVTFAFKSISPGIFDRRIRLALKSRMWREGGRQGLGVGTCRAGGKRGHGETLLCARKAGEKAAGRTAGREPGRGAGGEVGARHVRAGGCTCSSARIGGHRDPRAPPQRRASQRPSSPGGWGGMGGDKQPPPLPTCSPRPTRSLHSPLRSGSRAAHGAVRCGAGAAAALLRAEPQPRGRRGGSGGGGGGSRSDPGPAPALPPPPPPPTAPPQPVGRRSVPLSALCPFVRSRSGCGAAAPRAPRYSAGRGWEGARPREGVRERNANSSLLGTARTVVPPPLRTPSSQDLPPPPLLY